MPTMIYHVPFPLRPGAASASQIRPVKMREAFEAVGYDVIEISGYAAERRRRIRSLERELKQGLKVDFVYSEAATIPNAFTEARHFPLHFFLDRNFFRTLHRFQIPIGVFYRDVYWAFTDYVDSVGKPIAAVMRKLYEWDIDAYNRYVQVLFLPSLKMAPFLPGLKNVRLSALPPGAPGPCKTASRVPDVPLNLLYVGSVGGSAHGMEHLFTAVQNQNHIHLTVVTRRDEWESAKQQYGKLLGTNVTVAHDSSNQLESYYRDSDIAVLFVEPREYRDFAVPFKLFEYLGNEKPVIASAGTLAGEIIEQTSAGWTIPYAAQALRDLLSELTSDPNQVLKAIANASREGREQSWENRAREVAAVLTQD